MALGPAAPVRTLTDLRAWNLSHKDAGTVKYAQWNLDIADETDLERDRGRYEADRNRDLMLTASHRIDEMKTARLDPSPGWQMTLTHCFQAVFQPSQRLLV